MFADSALAKFENLPFFLNNIIFLSFLVDLLTDDRLSTDALLFVQPVGLFSPHETDLLLLLLLLLLSIFSTLASGLLLGILIQGLVLLGLTFASTLSLRISSLQLIIRLDLTFCLRF